MEVRCPLNSFFAPQGQVSVNMGFSYAKCSGCKTQNRHAFNVNNLLCRNIKAKQTPRRSLGDLVRQEHLAEARLVRSLPLRLPVTKFRVPHISGVGLLQRRRISRILHSGVCRLGLSNQNFEKHQEPPIGHNEEYGQRTKLIGQVACWMVTVGYVGWLFLLPYAPGDPVWAITPSTIQMIIDLSLNFFFILPLTTVLTGAAGFHGLQAPVLHPTSEALFNFVIGWTLLFAPLLFTDKKRDRFGGSLEILWITQLFLTNTVLAPYMAIRQNSAPADTAVPAQKRLDPGMKLQSISIGMTSGAYIVGLTGSLVGIVSFLWALIGRPEGGFGDVVERWNYFLNYVGSERLAYAFLVDIALYTTFQPWLIGDNLSNIREENKETVRILRFVPYVGLLAYIFGLQQQKSRKV